jgi:hypothetical protein
VGNISGAPLVMEGLLAFFVESTFIGLWLFGRNRLPAGAYAVDLHGEDTQQPMKMAAALSGEPALAAARYMGFMAFSARTTTAAGQRG